MKLILSMTVVAASLCVGIYLTFRLTERTKILGRYIALLEGVSLRMTYTSDCLAALFSDNFADHPFVEDRPFEIQFNEMTNRFHYALKSEDIRLLGEFSSGLGMSDTTAQLQHFRLYIRLLEERRDAAQEEVRLKGRVYRILPLSIGIAAAILLL